MGSLRTVVLTEYLTGTSYNPLSPSFPSPPPPPQRAAMLPFNETSTQVFTEKSYLQGGLLCGVTYGVGIPLYVLSLQNLWNRRQGTTLRKFTFIMLVVALFVLASLSYASNAQTVQLALIDNRDILVSIPSCERREQQESSHQQEWDQRQ